MNITLQVLPQTTVDLLHQDFTPLLSCFFLEEVGVELKDLVVNMLYCTLCLGLGLGGLLIALKKAKSSLTSPSAKSRFNTASSSFLVHSFLA